MNQLTLTTTKQEKTEYLSEVEDGFYLTENHARMIWQRNKTLIVKPVKFESAIGKAFYLIASNQVFGIIKIKNIEQIDLKKFEELKEQHRITENEVKEFFKAKKVLFAYHFSLEKKFELPKKITTGKPFDDSIDFIMQVKFLSEDNLDFVEKLKDISLMENFVGFSKQLHSGTKKDLDFFLNTDSRKLFDKIQEVISSELRQFCGEDKNIKLSEQADFISEDLYGLYDLKLVKKQPRLLSEGMGRVVPMEPVVRSFSSKKFYDSAEVVEYLFGS